MKKFSGILVAALVLFTSCNVNKIVKIGVIQSSPSADYDSAYKGLVDGLRKEGYVDKENIILDYVNTNGDLAVCVSTVEKFISEKYNLIYAIGTDAAKVASNLTTKVPILFSCVEDPVGDNLIKENNRPGTNLTGASDFPPCEAQLDAMKKIIPNLTRVAIIYDAKNNFSAEQTKAFKEICEKKKISYYEVSFVEKEEIREKIMLLKGVANAVYLPKDELVDESFTEINAACEKLALPVFCNSNNLLQIGALCSLTTNYYELGKATAVQAVAILFHEEQPKNMSVKFATKGNFEYSKNKADELGIILPEEYLK